MNGPDSSIAHEPAGCGCCLAVFVAIATAAVVVIVGGAVVMGLIAGGS